MLFLTVAPLGPSSLLILVHTGHSLIQSFHPLFIFLFIIIVIKASYLQAYAIVKWIIPSICNCKMDKV